MRCLFISNSLPPYQIPFFQELSHHVTLTVVSPIPLSQSRSALGWSSTFEHHRFGPYWLSTYLIPFTALSFAPRLLNPFYFLKFDIIVVGGYSSLSAIISIFFAFLLRRKLYLRCGTHDLSVNNPSKLAIFFKKLLFSFTHAIICYGSLSQEYVTSILPSKPTYIEGNTVDVESLASKIDYLANPTYLFDRAEILPPPRQSFIFGYIGQFIHRKNIIALLQAFDSLLLSQTTLSPHLLLVGTGPLQTSIDNYLSLRPYMADKVTILPSIPYKLIHHFYRYINLLVLPSLREPWGLVVNEVMSCNCPALVSSACGCVPDLMASADPAFILDDPTDTLELSQKMSLILESPSLVRAESERILSVIDRFTIKQAVAAYSHVFNTF